MGVLEQHNEFCSMFSHVTMNSTNIKQGHNRFTNQIMCFIQRGQNMPNKLHNAKHNAPISRNAAKLTSWINQKK
jgi:uncharacterized protein YwgA